MYSFHVSEIENLPLSPADARLLRRFVSDKFKVSADCFAVKHSGKPLSQMTKAEGKQLLQIARKNIK